MQLRAHGADTHSIPRPLTVRRPEHVVEAARKAPHPVKAATRAEIAARFRHPRR